MCVKKVTWIILYIITELTFKCLFKGYTKERKRLYFFQQINFYILIVNCFILIDCR